MWEAAKDGDSAVRFLCIACLEKRLGRRIKPGDFADLPITYLRNPFASARIEDRLGHLRGSLPA